MLWPLLGGDVSRYDAFMREPFDPHKKLFSLGCTPCLHRKPDGTPYIYLRYWRRVVPGERRKCEYIAEMWRRLLILQLDVRKGQQPRSVRALLAHGNIEVRQGRYVRPAG